MKKFFTALLLALTIAVPVGVVVTVPAGAVDIIKVCDNKGANAGDTDVCKDVKSQKSSDDNPVIKVINAVLQIVSYVVGVAAVIMIVVSGIKFMTAGGDPGAVKSARSNLIYALVGLVVVVLAQAIIYFVINKIR